LLHVILGDPNRFVKEKVAKSRRLGGEVVIAACFSSVFAMDLIDPMAGVVAAT
jgi:hypothetical protein